MKSDDRNLGMNRRISRRDLLHGVSALAATALVPGQILADGLHGLKAGSTTVAGYPPALTGLRGNHTGSFEVAHKLAREGRRDWGPVEDADADSYDLVVVGAGISGLAAAYFYRKSNPDARILIVDNHDDFGGHAKRNEFHFGGHTLLGYGGSQSLVAPSKFSSEVKTLLSDLGVDFNGFATAYDQEFYRRNALAGGVFFNRKDWGTDRLIRYDLGALGSYLPLASSPLSAAQAVQQMPMSDAARREFLRVLTIDEDRMPEIPADKKFDYLKTIS